MSSTSYSLRPLSRCLGLTAALLLSTLGSSAAYAVTCASDIGVLGTGSYTCDVTGIATGSYLHTINFSVDNINTLVTITSTHSANQLFFNLPIFENGGDNEYIADGGGSDPDGAGQHLSVDLSEYSYLVDPDYHVHPQGFALSGLSSYSLTFTAAPVPEADTYAMMLAGLGLVGFAVRRRRS
jgi:hypothetical protein